MIKKPHEQTGSAHTIIVVIISLLLLGVLGFVFWQNFIKSDSPSMNTSETINIESATNDQQDVSKENTTPAISPANYAYVNGASFPVDKSLGAVLSWSSNSEVSNISSSTLLDKEKALYGDANLMCMANSYPLGRISVRDSSTPFTGFELVKKLENGKYLYYQDDGKNSFCYSDRTELRSMIEEQISLIKTGLNQAQ